MKASTVRRTSRADQIDDRAVTRSLGGIQGAHWRAELGEDDQLRLVLRVDRELDFSDIAPIFLGDEDEAEAQHEREAGSPAQTLLADQGAPQAALH